jgi:hypothetical protein
MRAVLQTLVPFLIPFLAYAVWLVLARRPMPSDLRGVPWLRLSAAGLACVAAALLVFAETTAIERGESYAPARLEGGRIIEGGARQPRP